MSQSSLTAPGRSTSGGSETLAHAVRALGLGTTPDPLTGGRGPELGAATRFGAAGGAGGSGTALVRATPSQIEPALDLYPHDYVTGRAVGQRSAEAAQQQRRATEHNLRIVAKAIAVRVLTCPGGNWVDARRLKMGEVKELKPADVVASTGHLTFALDGGKPTDVVRFVNAHFHDRELLRELLYFAVVWAPPFLDVCAVCYLTKHECDCASVNEYNLPTYNLYRPPAYRLESADALQRSHDDAVREFGIEGSDHAYMHAALTLLGFCPPSWREAAWEELRVIYRETHDQASGVVLWGPVLLRLYVRYVGHFKPAVANFLEVVLSVLVFQPGRKLRTMLVLIGQSRAGKDMLARLFTAMVGQHLSTEVTYTEQMFGAHATPFLNRVFVSISDLDARVLNDPRLLTYVTSPMHTINQKYRDAVAVPNVAYLMWTNNSVVAPSPGMSRRGVVLTQPMYLAEQAWFFRVLSAALNDRQALRGYAEYLSTIDLAPGVNPDPDQVPSWSAVSEGLEHQVGNALLQLLEARAEGAEQAFMRTVDRAGAWEAGNPMVTQYQLTAADAAALSVEGEVPLVEGMHVAKLQVTNLAAFARAVAAATHTRSEAAAITPTVVRGVLEGLRARTWAVVFKQPRGATAGYLVLNEAVVAQQLREMQGVSLDLPLPETRAGGEMSAEGRAFMDAKTAVFADLVEIDGGEYFMPHHRPLPSARVEQLAMREFDTEAPSARAARLRAEAEAAAAGEVADDELDALFGGDAGLKRQEEKMRVAFAEFKAAADELERARARDHPPDAAATGRSPARVAARKPEEVPVDGRPVAGVGAKRTRVEVAEEVARAEIMRARRMADEAHGETVARVRLAALAAAAEEGEPGEGEVVGDDGSTDPMGDQDEGAGNPWIDDAAEEGAEDGEGEE